MSYLTNLPREISSIIYAYTDFESVFNCAFVCKQIQTEITENFYLIGRYTSAQAKKFLNISLI